MMTAATAITAQTAQNAMRNTPTTTWTQWVCRGVRMVGVDMGGPLDRKRISWPDGKGLAKQRGVIDLTNPAPFFRVAPSGRRCFFCAISSQSRIDQHSFI